jgi:predicted dehydrogenase
VLLTFTNSIIASIDCSWSKPPYYPTWGGLKMEIVGEKGLVTMDAFKQNITVYSHQVGRPKYHFWGSDIDGGMISDFIAAVREQRAPRVTGEDGLRAVEIVAAAYQSAASGQPVTL